MDLRKTLITASEVLQKNGIAHALIGGFSLAVHGVPRTTQDVDFLADGEKKEQIKRILTHTGFSLRFESNEVLQFGGPGFIDILLANRPLSQKMLTDAILKSDFPVKVLKVEDIIGLKIQAYHNDPKRKLQDLADIKALANKNSNCDLKQIKVYADLFNCWEEISEVIK